ncbi:hypothetical protein T484DRAFT_3334971 [Baffinella frigidus]|nr:hypothetical protein T484DRAFT_3334971 [Cryptophyta sp. CCMP2293]
MTDQGYRSYIIAEDTDRGEIVGCCQLNRVQVGGYLYLTEDLIIKNFYVNKDYRGYGIGNNLVHEALLRLKPSERAWAIVTKKTPEFNFFFSSGFVGLLWQECAKVFPGIVWVLLWPFHGKRLSMGPDCVFLACEGRGGTDAFNPAG